MITHISIKNFAIIENSSVDFDGGLNIITGETGAGKSIVIQAISLALGARADTTLVRSSCDKAIIQMIASYSDYENTSDDKASEAKNIIEKEVIITREIYASGKSISKINGEIVTLAQLGDISRKIADIHGQYDHQSLLNPDYHISLTDKYHREDIDPVKERVSQIYHQYKNTEHELKMLLSNAADKERQRDFMQFQLDEIRNANLYIGEDDELKERINLLQNGEKIHKGLAVSYELLYERDGSALEVIRNITKELSSIAEYNIELEEIDKGITDLYYTLEDYANNIRVQRDNSIFSQEELDTAIERYEFIGSLKRKYGSTIEDILAFGDNLKINLSNIDNIQERQIQLERDLSMLSQQLELASERLTTLRKNAAQSLELKIMEQLKDLSFQNSEFQIKFDTLPDFTDNGKDSISFLISTNKGEPLKPLSKIASGGEMSRIMLAFKKIVADYDDIPTLIFDEIDSGISGIAASIVGKKLKEIAQNHQILCITHLPQIAACGDHNYKIEKTVSEDKTITEVVGLTDQDTINEIARLLGGANITSTTLESAKELISASK